MACVGIGSGDGTRGEAMEEQRRGADVTKIELDHAALDAAREALEDWAFNNKTESVSVGAESIVRAYLAQALRLRPMSEAPWGEDRVEYIIVYWWDDDRKKWQSTLGHRDDDEVVTERHGRARLTNYCGWLPLPQPVEPGS